MKLFTAVLVYLFVLTVRRLSGKPVTTYIKCKYGKTALDSFRRTEKLSYRSKKLQKDVKFLNLCKIYDVIPRFLNFRVHNPVFESTLTYRSWCFILLDREILSQKKKESVITEKLNKELTLLNSKLSPLDYICIKRLINKNVHKKLLEVDKIHTNNTFKKFSRLANQTSDAERFTSPLQSLKNDESIIITKPDKGRGVVILNKDDYHQKVLNILSDHTKFKRITTEMSTHLLYLEDKLKRLLRTIKSSIDASTYNFLSTSGSKPGLLYGLPKFFANEITSLNPEQPITMASFDVESLFTNVPLLETSEIIVNNINSTHLNKFDLTKDSFKKLLHIAAHHSSIKFTCETQQNNQLPFLDMYVTNDNGRFHTSIYRKPTFTGLGLHFLSNIPYIYKINSIKTLITRAYNLCSNWSSFHDEMNFLKDIFEANSSEETVCDTGEIAIILTPRVSLTGKYAVIFKTKNCSSDPGQCTASDSAMKCGTDSPEICACVLRVWVPAVECPASAKKRPPRNGRAEEAADTVAGLCA
ncbi:uncharacterized protein [Penaeus vannamei]|uniref:uncharacterized protein n=1 Tax=Penaeus vannamei TaxID=6689 RepID=UPI00387F823F